MVSTSIKFMLKRMVHDMCNLRLLLGCWCQTVGVHGVFAVIEIDVPREDSVNNRIVAMGVLDAVSGASGPHDEPSS